MKIFISWSGTRSKAVATAVDGWLRKVIQAVEPWMSTDIQKGRRWGPEIAAQLEESKIGILCLTKENLKEPWLLFEAGALSKTKDAHVCTLLLDIVPADVELPLGMFQHTTFDKTEMFALTRTINEKLPTTGAKVLPDGVLTSSFDTYWPDINEKLSAIVKQPVAGAIAPRKDRDILEEILEILRNQQRSRVESDVFTFLNADVAKPTGAASRELLNYLAADPNFLRRGIGGLLTSAATAPTTVPSSGIGTLISETGRPPSPSGEKGQTEK